MLPEMLDAAHAGTLDVLISSGGNFTEVMPDPVYTREALERIPVRVHIDICLSSQMLVPASSLVVLLPAQTRYEMAGGVTETSTERRIIFSPEIPGPRIEQAWPEYRVFGELVARARPDLAKAVQQACLDRQLLLLTCGAYGNTVRWIPPLVASEEQIADALSIFGDSVAQAAGKMGS